MAPTVLLWLGDRTKSEGWKETGKRRKEGVTTNE